MSDDIEDDAREVALERIMAGARAVFARDGIHARMGKIAEAAGMSRATLYRYFPKKEELLQAYMLKVQQDFQQVLDKELSHTKRFDRRLVEATALSIELMRGSPEVAPFFTEEGVGLTAQLTANSAALRDGMTARLQAENDSKRISGGLRRGVTAKEAADWLVRTIFSFALLPSPLSGPELRKYLRKVLVPALARE